MLAQVRGYRKLIEKHRDEMIESYQKVARNLVEIAGVRPAPNESSAI